MPGANYLLRSPIRPIIRPNRLRRFPSVSRPSQPPAQSRLAVFGEAPSEEEAEAALSALNQVFIQFSEDTVTPITGIPIPPETLMPSVTGIPIPWESSPAPITGITIPSETSVVATNPAELSLNRSNSTGLNRIRNSLSLLNKTPSIQKLVLSLSTDKAVWDAIMKNEAVQELHSCIFQAGKNEPLAFLGQDSFVPSILKWVIENSKNKIVELIDQISELLSALFKANGSDETLSILNDVIKNSFMLTVMVLLVVIVSRLQIDTQ